jgi:hypothetical protein
MCDETFSLDLAMQRINTGWRCEYSVIVGIADIPWRVFNKNTGEAHRYQTALAARTAYKALVFNHFFPEGHPSP